MRPRQLLLRPLALLVVPVALVAAGCGSGSSGPAAAPTGSASPATTATATAGGSPTTAASPATGFPDWPTYHRTAGRSGLAAAPVSSPLHQAWTARLSGSVWEEPVVAHGVLVAGTESDDVYGLNPTTGKQVWHDDLGTPEPADEQPCGDIRPIGITGSPAYDPSTGSVFVVTTTGRGNHTLWALSATTGARRWHRSIDLDPSVDRNAEQQRSPLLVTHGRVVVTYGAHEGDCGNYVGYAVSAPVSGRGSIPYYAPHTHQAGMWSPAGPVSAADGNVLIPTANGSNRTGGAWDHSDGVVELDPTTMHFVRGWAPTNWLQGDADDLSLSSTSPVAIDGHYIVGGKRGLVWLLPASLGGVGGQLDTLGTTAYCRAFGGIAVSGSTAILPCTGFGTTDSVLAVGVSGSTLHQKWRTTGLEGSPVIAGSKVYVANRNTGMLDVLSLASGHVEQTISVGALPTFPSEVVDGGDVFVPTLAGVTALRGS